MKNDYKRQLRRKPLQPDLIMIFTEGTKTEPNYFNCFKLTSVRLELIGTGMNTKSLVKYIKDKTNDLIKDYAHKHHVLVKDVDYQVWVVFDKDDFPKDNFDNAIALAKDKSCEVAWSNESFELWYYLHFHYHETGSSRTWYNDRLTELLGCKYEKNSKLMYAKLKHRQSDAIKRSQKLFKKSIDEPSSSKRNPCTTVHALVKYLNKFVVQ